MMQDIILLIKFKNNVMVTHCGNHMLYKSTLYIKWDHVDINFCG